MVDDLIERATLIRCIEKWLPRDKCGEETLEDSILTDLCVSMLMEIAEQPTIDAVPVVRCKDCKLHGHCYTEDVFIFARMGNPFCCAGKRKDGDNNG